MNKLYVILAIFVLLPLLFGGATMAVIIVSKFSQVRIEQAAPSETEMTTTSTPTAPNEAATSEVGCGDGICSKVERASNTCLIDC
jgi:hypothetical protein